ncbi:hypothetical protein CL619_04320 [archaeon]|nr:hypothetical protein [archaeon]|tara:strand:- start:3569 stop:4114 length:546 start_codon:yes stop_codon:yes gene_type:complete
MGKMTIARENIFRDKKGQGIGQVFVFIVAGLTFAFVMIFGYKAIADFLEKGETVEFLQFKNEIESDIKQIASEYGAVRQTTFYLPARYEEVCFIDLDAEYDSSSELCQKNIIACDVWETAFEEGGYTAADENVFLEPTAPVSIKVYNIELDEDYFCATVSGGQFTLRLEGLGSKTYLSEAS